MCNNYLQNLKLARFDFAPVAIACRSARTCFCLSSNRCLLRLPLAAVTEIGQLICLSAALRLSTLTLLPYTNIAQWDVVWRNLRRNQKWITNSRPKNASQLRRKVRYWMSDNRQPRACVALLSVSLTLWLSQTAIVQRPDWFIKLCFSKEGPRAICTLLCLAMTLSRFKSTQSFCTGGGGGGGGSAAMRWLSLGGDCLGGGGSESDRKVWSGQWLIREMLWLSRGGGSVWGTRMLNLGGGLVWGVLARSGGTGSVVRGLERTTGYRVVITNEVNHSGSRSQPW